MSKAVVWQRPRLYALQETAVFNDARFSILEGSVKSGKSAGGLVWLVEEALHRGPGDYVWLAPSYAQSMMMFRRLLTMAPRELVTDTNITQGTVTLAGGRVLWFRSSDRENLLFGASYLAAVVDEASRCSERSWHALRSTLSATNGRCRLLTNVSGRSWVWQLARQVERGEKPGWEFHRLTWSDSVEAGILDPEDVAEAKRTLPAVQFDQLYESILSADDAALFAVDKIKVIPEAPDEVDALVRGWDLASSEHRASSWSCGVLVGMDFATDEVIIADLARFRSDPGGTMAQLIATAASDGEGTPLVIEEERGSSGRLLLSEIARQLPGHRVEDGKLSADKTTRSYPLAGRVGQGKVSVVDAPWTQDLLQELSLFPHGAHSDQVDSLAHAFNWLEAQRAKVYAPAKLWKPTRPLPQGVG